MAKRPRPKKSNERRAGRPRQPSSRDGGHRGGLRIHGDQLEGRNVVVEALSRRRRRVHRVYVDDRARPHPKLDRLLSLAQSLGVPVTRVARDSLDAISVTGVHNGVIADAEGLPTTTVAAVLDRCLERGEDPFFVLLDEVNYEHNLGAVLRSALGAGVHAVVIPTRRGKGVTAVVQRVSMGGAEAVEVIREGLSSALKTLRRAGVRVLGADMDGTPLWEVSMTGPLAVVLGGEDKGLTHTLRDRCDEVVSVPLDGELDSLNVSVTAGILLFEKVRQGQGAKG